MLKLETRIVSIRHSASPDGSLCYIIYREFIHSEKSGVTENKKIIQRHHNGFCPGIQFK